MGDTWCEFCRDHFPTSHLDENFMHRVGFEWGATGAELALIHAALAWDEAHQPWTTSDVLDLAI